MGGGVSLGSRSGFKTKVRMLCSVQIVQRYGLGVYSSLAPSSSVVSPGAGLSPSGLCARGALCG